MDLADVSDGPRGIRVMSRKYSLFGKLHPNGSPWCTRIRSNVHVLVYTSTAGLRDVHVERCPGWLLLVSGTGVYYQGTYYQGNPSTNGKLTN